MDITAFKKFIQKEFFSAKNHHLTYHGLEHTLEVLSACDSHIKRSRVDERTANNIRTAALLHDTGIFTDYFDHERKSVENARAILPHWGASSDDIEDISNMIMATHIPQKPGNLPEMVLCDSDVDYLGTGKFYSNGNRLFQELRHFGLVQNEEDWDRFQARFLLKHTYHTPFALRYREPVKRRYLQEILDKYGWVAQDILSMTQDQKLKNR